MLGIGPYPAGVFAQKIISIGIYPFGEIIKVVVELLRVLQRKKRGKSGSLTSYREKESILWRTRVGINNCNKALTTLLGRL